MDEISDIYDLYKYRTMIVTYNEDEGLEIADTNDEEYQTRHLHRSNFLNCESSVIKVKCFANGHFKESNDAPKDSYKYNLKDFDMIKAVADKRTHLGLTNKKEFAICLAMDYIASSTNKLPIDYATKFSRIVNWATAMYTTFEQDATVEDYLKPDFMDGYIKKGGLPIHHNRIPAVRQGDGILRTMKIDRTKNIIMVIPSLNESHPSMEVKSPNTVA